MKLSFATKWVASAVALMALSSAFAALNDKDTKFVRGAYQGSWSEVQLGNLALKRARSKSVRDFGQRMITDHGKAMNDVANLAKRKGVPMPRSMKTEQRQMQEKLSRLKGPAFDREYKRMMVADHMEDVREFQETARDARDPDVRAAAKKWLPILREHLRMAKDMRA